MLASPGNCQSLPDPGVDRAILLLKARIGGRTIKEKREVRYMKQAIEQQALFYEEILPRE